MSRDHRSSLTPMEFEWQHQSGPVDQQSPFITAAHAHKKRPHSQLESPSKNDFNTSNVPHFREANGQHYYFSQDSKALPPTPKAIPAHVTDPWAPRTPPRDFDFSSGGETPNTPQIDSEQATPDTHMAKKMGGLSYAETKSPKKGRRESWLVRMFTSSPSSTKDKEASRRHYSTKGEGRITKRRSKKSKMALQEYESDSEQQSPDKNSAPTQQVEPKLSWTGGIAGFFAWLEAHPHLPSVLSFYMQLVVNMFLGALFIYIIYSAWAGVMNDVDIESRKSMSEVMVEIALCAKNYRENRCEPHTRVPAMEQACGNWETCMQRDPKKVARASVTAKTFAMIFNSFVEEFSYKSMIFTAIIIFGGFNLSNWAFGLLREKHSPHQHNDYPPPPATPQRYPSNGFIDQQPWQTPYHTPYGTMTRPQLQHASQSLPALPSVDGVQEAFERKSPSKRRLFR